MLFISNIVASAHEVRRVEAGTLRQSGGGALTPVKEA
jgi:hypothetical protein